MCQRPTIKCKRKQLLQRQSGNKGSVSWTTLIVQREGAALEQAGEEIKKPFFALHFLIPFTNSYIALLQIPGLVPRPIVYNALTPFANLLKNALREGLKP
jgi:hypothetical protein